MTSIRRAVRESGVLDALYPADRMKHEAAIRRAVDEAGRPVPGAFDRIRTPLTLEWGNHKRAARAGTAVLLAAYASTPPSTGPCIITLTIATELMGETEIGTVRITQGRAIGEATLNYPVPAGAWLGAIVTTANGAAGVSISLTVTTGSTT